jgi:hypothetical protein
VQITSVSLALLVSLSASPAFAESDSYEDMLKKFKSKQADTVKQYEKAAKTSSNLIAAPTAPVSDKLPFGSFFGDKKEPTSAPPTSDAPKPLSSFAAPKVDMPKMPDLPEMPAFSAPKMPSFSAPKFDMPKTDTPAAPPSVPASPAPPAPVIKKVEPAPVAPKAAVPKPVAPPVVRAPTPPPVAVKPYAAPATPVAPPKPAPAATSSQGDYMDRWQKDQVRSGSVTKALTTPSKRSSAPTKKEAPTKKAVRSGKRQGPLPLFLAEFLMLCLIGGFLAATVLLQDVLKGAYVAADKAIANATANFNKRSD